jgi:hypothetical protein
MQTAKGLTCQEERCARIVSQERKCAVGHEIGKERKGDGACCISSSVILKIYFENLKTGGNI